MAIPNDEPVLLRPLVRQQPEESKFTYYDFMPLRGVYFIGWHGFIKVGMSDDVRFRSGDWCQMLPTLHEELGWIHVPGRVEVFEHERAVLKALRPWRSREDYKTEWHKDCPEVRAFIAKHAKPWPPKSLRGQRCPTSTPS